MRLPTTLFPDQTSVSELITGTETPVPDGPVWELWLAPYEVRWLAAIS